MNRAEIEAWALAVVEAVREGRTSEDSRVELKSEWIDPTKAARRLAGHANAARGDSILWLVGIRDDGNLVPVNATDFATWWPKVAGHFDGPVPRPTEVHAYPSGATILCLAFTTDEAPYVVRNPLFGQPQMGPIEREVPWREMTQIRSARHDDLIRLLVPLSKLPEVEVLSATLAVTNAHAGPGGRPQADEGRDIVWTLEMELYVVPRSTDRLVLPIHRVRISLHESALGEVKLTPSRRLSSREGPRLDQTSDFIVEGPGRLGIHGQHTTRELSAFPDQHANVTVTLMPAGSDRSIVLACQFARTSTWHYDLANWTPSTTLV